MNLPVIIVAGILSIALVLFLVYKNVKDEQKYEEDMNNTYPFQTKEKDEIVTNDLENDIH